GRSRRRPNASGAPERIEEAVDQSVGAAWVLTRPPRTGPPCPIKAFSTSDAPFDSQRSLTVPLSSHQHSIDVAAVTTTRQQLLDLIVAQHLTDHPVNGRCHPDKAAADIDRRPVANP